MVEPQACHEDDFSAFLGGEIAARGLGQNGAFPSSLQIRNEFPENLKHLDENRGYQRGAGAISLIL
jgi:hypothetical protein